MRSSKAKILSLLVAGMLVTPIALQASGFQIQQRILKEEIPGISETIIIYLYTSNDAEFPIAAESYYPGEWTTSEDNGEQIFRASFSDAAAVADVSELWMEIEAEGKLVGERQLLENPGITLAGDMIDMGSNLITNLGVPVISTDAANRGYVDSAITTGTAAKALQLRDLPSACPAGKYPRGVSRFGDAEGCTTDQVGIADNLGDHIATTDIQLGNHHISGGEQGASAKGIAVNIRGQVSINHPQPQNNQVTLGVFDGTDCELTGTGGYIQNDSRYNLNMCIDDNEIMVRNDGVEATLYLNHNGGLVHIGDELLLTTLGAAGATDICRNASNILSTCSSSGRYKEEIEPLPLGLDIVQKLNPVSFKWKEQDGRDLGFVAESVADIDPILATYTEDGQVEGVKYKQLTAVLVNAIKEQQNQIAALQRELQKFQSLAAKVSDLEQRLDQSPDLLVTLSRH